MYYHINIHIYIYIFPHPYIFPKFVGGTDADNPQRFGPGNQAVTKLMFLSEVTVINFTVTLLGLEVGSK